MWDVSTRQVEVRLGRLGEALDDLGILGLRRQSGSFGAAEQCDLNPCWLMILGDSTSQYIGDL